MFVVPTVSQMMVPYVSATLGALITALGLNYVTKYAPPLIGRCVPFTAVAAANCINVPLMRQSELINGIEVIISYHLCTLYNTRLCN